MVNGHSPLKLVPASILDICKVFEHIDILIWGQRAAASNSYSHTTFIRFGGSESLLWSQNDVVISLFRLTANSNCFLHPHHTYTTRLSILICCPWVYGSSLKQLYPPYLAHTLWFWVTCGVKMMSLCHG